MPIKFVQSRSTVLSRRAMPQGRAKVLVPVEVLGKTRVLRARDQEGPRAEAEDEERQEVQGEVPESDELEVD